MKLGIGVTPCRACLCSICLRTGYAQSKWVAEQLALAAGRRGLPVVVHRAGRISGHSQTGATCAWEDLANRLLKACIVLGAYPDWDVELGLAPVDFVSRALVHLVGSPSAWGRCFHLFDPQPIRWRALMSILVEYGYPLTGMEHDAWLAQLKRVATRAHPERETLARWVLPTLAVLSIANVVIATVWRQYA